MVADAGQGGVSGALPAVRDVRCSVNHILIDTAPIGIAPPNLYCSDIIVIGTSG